MPNENVLSNESPSPRVTRTMKWLLIGGIVVRLAVLLNESGVNPDRHMEVIAYIVDHHRLPISEELGQSYHPPLYYLLMAPIYAWWRDAPPLHFLSFVISCANLVMIWRVLRDRAVIARDDARAIAFAFICFLPEVVMFGNFISNDTLTMLIGTMQFIAAIRWLREPRMSRLILLAVLVALGLLTKGTFILTGPALTLIVAMKLARDGLRKVAIGVVTFCLIWLALGSYKYVENYVHVGRPIVHNLDKMNDVMLAQRGVWKGWQTVCDVNVIKLIRRPILQIRNTFSYPLLMYATFWYPHIPESTFTGNVYGYQWVGSIIYTLGVVPTLIFLIGTFRAIVQRSEIALLSLALLLSNVAVVIAAGVKFDVWSCFQSRLCFQSLVPIAVLFGVGYESIAAQRWLRRVVFAICCATIATCVLYFVIEIAFAHNWIPRGVKVEP